MSKPNLQKTAQQLGTLAQLISNREATVAEVDRFYGMLDKILSLAPAHESVVTAMAMSGLVELGDQDTARWLAEELDIECELQYLPNATGREKACLLFALPIVVPGGSALMQHASDDELFSELHAIVSESDVVDQSAEFGLVPRLFSYPELFGQSYGQLRTLTRHLSQQVLTGQTHLQLPSSFEGSSVLEGPCCSPYVDLYFVIGAVCTDDSALDGVFPALESDLEDGEREGMALDEEGGFQSMDLGEAGKTEDGQQWEKAFCVAFDDAFGALEGSLTVLPPDGLPEDLRRGLELSREIGLLEMFEGAVAPDAPAIARLGALQEVDDEAYLPVSYVKVRGGESLLTTQWPVLNHETIADALDKLIDCLADASISQEFPMADQLNPTGSLLLH